MGNVAHVLEARECMLARIKDVRDAPAWQAFVSAYGQTVYAYGRRRGLQDADAADLTQEVLADVARCIRTFEYQGEGSFRRWLKVIVLNRFQDRLRQAQREENNGVAPARDGLGVDLADPRGRSPEEEVELSDFQAHALACMSELDEDDQEVLTLRLFEKASHAQAAEVLELSPPAARKRYHQALDRLMQRIDAGGETRAP